jgi:hypothetical protein
MGSDLKGLLDKLKSKEGTQEDAYNFLVRAGIIRPKERTLEGQEKEEMMLILKLITPYDSSNNQRFWTDEYKYGDNRYSVTYFDENEYEITEIKP